MCGGTPSAPPPPARQPEAAQLPEAPSGAGAADADARRRALAAGAGASTSTILTSSRGVQNGGATATKTLLGQ